MSDFRKCPYNLHPSYRERECGEKHGGVGDKAVGSTHSLC